MANFSKVTSTICGASTQLNDMLNSADKFADDLITQLENAVDPSALIDSVSEDLKILLTLFLFIKVKIM